MEMARSGHLEEEVVVGWVQVMIAEDQLPQKWWRRESHRWHCMTGSAFSSRMMVPYGPWVIITTGGSVIHPSMSRSELQPK